MTARTEAAQAFVALWEYLVRVYGRALALADGALLAARRVYREASA